MKKIIVFSCVVSLLSACDRKPSGVSDEFYEKYKLLGAPKILYRCGNEIGYSAGIGMNATYNHIVSEAKNDCEKSSSRKFSILESQQYAADNR